MMFRSSRNFLMRINEFSNIHYVRFRVPSRQRFSKFAEKKPRSHESYAGNSHKRFLTSQFNELHAEEVNNLKTSLNSEDNKYVSNPKNAFNMHSPIEFTKIFYSGDPSAECNSLSVVKAIQVLKWLSNTKSRPVKLIKALTQRICQEPTTLNVKNCSDIMYCLATFSFKDVEVLNKVATDVIKNKNSITFTPISTSLLLSCGILKYRNCELLDILLKAICSEKNPKGYNKMITAIFTLAMVNYFPTYGVVILNELLKCSVTDFHQTNSYVDFVWATVLLKQISQEHISVVLSEQFLSKLKAVQGVLKNSMTMKLKLMNINAAAKHLLPSYEGPYLNTTEYNVSPPSVNNSTYLLPLIDGLSHLFPKKSHLLANVDTGAGFRLDVECYVDPKKKIVTSKKDSVKIGFMVLNFNDFCLGPGNVESGLTSFKESILVAKGYKVIKINNAEYTSKLKLFEKIHYLKEKLENVCSG